RDLGLGVVERVEDERVDGLLDGEALEGDRGRLPELLELAAEHAAEVLAEGLAVGEDDAAVAGVHRVPGEEVEEVVRAAGVVLVDTVEPERLEERLLLADVHAG